MALMNIDSQMLAKYQNLASVLCGRDMFWIGHRDMGMMTKIYIPVVYVRVVFRLCAVAVRVFTLS